MLYTVGEMAKLLGVPASTLRYYDKEGLLPFVERSPGGMRVFHDEDYEWLQTIGCLKKTGMRLKEIRTYIDMAMRGDETLRPRLQMIRTQRETVLAQMAELQKNLDLLDFKCWYYETALQAGAADAVRSLSLEQTPEPYRAARAALCQPPRAEQPLQNTPADPLALYRAGSCSCRSESPLSSSERKEP